MAKTNLRHEWEASRRAHIALDHLELVVLRDQLHVEWTGDVLQVAKWTYLHSKSLYQALRNRVSNLGDALNRFLGQVLWRRYKRCITLIECINGVHFHHYLTGVHSRILHMLRDGYAHHFTVLRHAVNVDFLRVQYEFADNDRVILHDFLIHFIGVKHSVIPC